MDNFEKLYKKSLHFLSFRPRSEKEIRVYLKKNNAQEQVAEKIIESLRISKFLDDAEFTRWWFEQRTKINPKSTRIIKIELLQKGIDKEMVQDLLSENKNLDLESARKIAAKKYERIKHLEKKKVYEKLFRFLGSKGFDYDIIKEVIDQIFSKGYND
jgi:regulatory protein